MSQCWSQGRRDGLVASEGFAFAFMCVCVRVFVPMCVPMQWQI